MQQPVTAHPATLSPLFARKVWHCACCIESEKIVDRDVQTAEEIHKSVESCCQSEFAVDIHRNVGLDIYAHYNRPIGCPHALGLPDSARSAVRSLVSGCNRIPVIHALVHSN